MQFASHPALERRINQLMLTHATKALEGAGDDLGAIMIAVAGQIVDLNFTIRKGFAQKSLEVGLSDRHDLQMIHHVVRPELRTEKYHGEGRETRRVSPYFPGSALEGLRVTARSSIVMFTALVSAALSACGSLDMGGAAQNLAARSPRPAEGLWAILDPGCAKPSLADPRRWPRCASPFWISHSSAVVVRSRPATGPAVSQASYRTDYTLAPGDPLIARVGNRKDGYLFLALTGLARDDRGRLVAAVGAVFACPRSSGGSVAAAPTRGGCEGRSADSRRRAAEQTLKDPSALSRVAWIAPGAPEPGAKDGKD